MSSETVLWRAVVHRAFLDASQAAARYRPGAERRRADQECRRARAWLAGGGGDLVEVSLMAGLDPTAVTAQAARLRANLWRPFPGMGEMFLPGDGEAREPIDERQLLDESFLYC